MPRLLACFRKVASAIWQCCIITLVSYWMMMMMMWTSLVTCIKTLLLLMQLIRTFTKFSCWLLAVAETVSHSELILTVIQWCWQSACVDEVLPVIQLMSYPSAHSLVFVHLRRSWFNLFCGCRSWHRRSGINGSWHSFPSKMWVKKELIK